MDLQEELGRGKCLLASLLCRQPLLASTALPAARSSCSSTLWVAVAAHRRPPRPAPRMPLPTNSHLHCPSPVRRPPTSSLPASSQPTPPLPTAPSLQCNAPLRASLQSWLASQQAPTTCEPRRRPLALQPAAHYHCRLPLFRLRRWSSPPAARGRACHRQPAQAHILLCPSHQPSPACPPRALHTLCCSETLGAMEQVMMENIDSASNSVVLQVSRGRRRSSWGADGPVLSLPAFVPACVLLSCP